MHTVNLNRDQYLDSVTQMTHFKSLKFAKQSMDTWDNYYSWKKFPCLTLVDHDQHVCYLFYSISKSRDYLTIHNIFTPFPFRDKGYAYELLSKVFDTLTSHDIERFKMFCVSSSIDFYNKMGLNYWGVNDVGQYYCDFKMPLNGIDGIKKIVKDTTVREFSDDSLENIYKKLELNGSELVENKKIIHENCIEKMGKQYLFDSIYNQVHR